MEQPEHIRLGPGSIVRDRRFLDDLEIMSEVYWRSGCWRVLAIVAGTADRTDQDEVALSDVYPAEQIRGWYRAGEWNPGPDAMPEPE